MADQLEGAEVKLGRRAFVVPPITVWSQEQLEAAVIPEDPKEATTALFGQMVMLLEPNYPDITVEELKKCVPLRRLSECATAVARAAAFGLGGTPGEAAGPQVGPTGI